MSQMTADAFSKLKKRDFDNGAVLDEIWSALKELEGLQRQPDPTALATEVAGLREECKQAEAAVDRLAKSLADLMVNATTALGEHFKVYSGSSQHSLCASIAAVVARLATAEAEIAKSRQMLADKLCLCETDSRTVPIFLTKMFIRYDAISAERERLRAALGELQTLFGDPHKRFEVLRESGWTKDKFGWYSKPNGESYPSLAETVGVEAKSIIHAALAGEGDA